MAAEYAALQFRPTRAGAAVGAGVGASSRSSDKVF